MSLLRHKLYPKREQGAHLNNLSSFRTAIETLQYPLHFQKNLNTYIFWENILRLSIAIIILSPRKVVADGDFLDVISKRGDERCQGIALKSIAEWPEGDRSLAKGVEIQAR